MSTRNFLFFLRGYRHSEREKLRQQTLDNSWTNVFGFGSISIKALMYGTNRYRGVTSDPDYFCLMGAIIMHYKGIPFINVVL